MAGFYIRRGDRTRGPVSSGQLRQLAASGTLRPGDEVRQGTDGRWHLASTVDGLFPEPESIDEWDELASWEASGDEVAVEHVPQQPTRADEPTVHSTYTPSPASPARTKRRRRDDVDVDGNRYFWIGVMALGSVVLIGCLVGLFIPGIGLTVILGIHLVGSGIGLVSGIWLLLLAFEEDSTTGLLYLFIPCFALYFFFSRFDGSLPFRLAIASWVCTGIALSYGALLGAMGGLPPIAASEAAVAPSAVATSSGSQHDDHGWESDRLPSSNVMSRCLALSRKRVICASRTSARQAWPSASPEGAIAFTHRCSTVWRNTSWLASRSSSVASENDPLATA